MAQMMKLFSKTYGLCDECLVRSVMEEGEIKKDWSEKYGSLFNRFYIKVVEDGCINPFLIPQKLNRCKYDLIIYGRILKTIITEKFNREYCLKEMLVAANNISDIKKLQQGMAFKIYLTEDGIKSLLLDSKTDKQFIKLLYEKNERSQY